MDGSDEEVRLGWYWHLDVGRWEPGDGVTVSDGLCLPNPDSVAAVVLR